MNFSPTPNSPTPSRSGPERHWRNTTVCLLLGVLAWPLARAHGEADDPLPPEPGLTWDAAIALRALHRNTALPSTRLQGQLLQGDAGIDPKGNQLEHGTLGLAHRLDNTWGARLVLGKHGSERAEVEEAWLQARLDANNGDAWWLNVGRVRPAMGSMLDQAGHFDRSGLAPLAHRMAWDHGWRDEGVQLSWRRDNEAGNWSVDAGLWQGDNFPGSKDGPNAPSLHLGWAKGPWRADAAFAWFQPAARGIQASLSNDHAHGAPECTPSFVEVVCFEGKTRLAGASLQWDGRTSQQAWPLTLSVAGWQRNDQGQLESADGLARYRGRARGGWLDLLWHLGTHTDIGWRGERLVASHRLEGAGATQLAQATRLQAYAPVVRHTLMLAHRLTPWASLHLEAGEETQATQRAHFVAARLLLTAGSGR